MNTRTCPVPSLPSRSRCTSVSGETVESVSSPSVRSTTALIRSSPASSRIESYASAVAS